jgi:hypothetical protein
MTSHQLPDRANLEQLKKQAKSLLAAARSQEPHAIARFEAVLIGRSLKPDVIALHDAQFVLAREYGFASWPELKQEVEERSLSFAAARMNLSAAPPEAHPTARCDCSRGTPASHTPTCTRNSCWAMPMQRKRG